MNSILENNKSWIEDTWNKLNKKLLKTAVTCREIIPYTSANGKYIDKYAPEHDCWTNGFWGGLMWLMYAATKNEEYKKTAEKSEELMDKCFENVETLHHDVGFMWHLLSGANYRLTGNKASKNRNILAAATLASRYHLTGEYIQAWNHWGENSSPEGWSIIDCMMNIPLLYWASDEIGSSRFRQIAISHANMTMRDHIRPDGSVNHIVSHDPETGEFIESFGGQGYAVGSSWSRGQAWAIYGFILSYIHTGDKNYLDTAKKVAHYFISCVADTDYLPLCDFRAPSEPVKYDSTAGACAACGLIEIAKAVPEYEKSIYLNAAIKILKAMDKKFCDWNENTDPILLMGTESYSSTNGLHIPIIYGDYFYTEAIYKLKGFDFLIW